MHPSMLTYAAIGAVGFSLLSAIATKYRGDEFEMKNFGRDALAGALLTAFLLTLVPDILPQLTILSGAGAVMTAITNSVASKATSFTGGGPSGGDMEFDLQVGYPGRR